MYSRSLYHTPVSSPTGTYLDNKVRNNATTLHLRYNMAYMSLWIEGGGCFVHKTPKNDALRALSPTPLPYAILGKQMHFSWAIMCREALTYCNYIHAKY